MRVLSLDPTPFSELMHHSAAPRGGSEVRSLPLLRGRVDRLPDDVEALLVTSDLQGVAPLTSADGATGLLGIALAEHVEMLAACDELFGVQHLGVVLAGDLYSEARASKRGATGDVREAWSAFARIARFVVGVAGNHDQFGSPREQARFAATPGVHLLDGDVVALGGIRCGGVGGIIGDPHKHARREEESFVAAVRHVLAQKAELLVLHSGPDAPSLRQPGLSAVRAAVDVDAAPLVVCGHAHWDAPLDELARGGQVLNVDARAVLLMR